MPDPHKLPQSPSEAEELRIERENAIKECQASLKESLNTIAESPHGEKVLQWLAQQCGYGVVIPPFGVQNGVVLDAQGLMVWNAARQELWWEIHRLLLPTLRGKILNEV